MVTNFWCPWAQKKCPLKRGVHLWTVKNVVFICTVTENMTKCPITGCLPTRGLHWWRFDCTLHDCMKQKARMTVFYYINHVILIYVQTIQYKLHYKQNLTNKNWFDPRFSMLQNNIYKDLKNSSSLVITKRFTEQCGITCVLLQPN